MDFVRTAKGTYFPVREISCIYEKHGTHWLCSKDGDFDEQQVLPRDLPKTDNFGVIPNVESGYKVICTMKMSNEPGFGFEFEIHPVLGWIVRDTELTPLIQEQFLVTDHDWFILRPDGTVYETGTDKTMENVQELKRFVEKEGGVYTGGTLPEHGD